MVGKIAELPPIGRAGEAASQRFIAVRHRVDIETQGSELQKAWASAVALCGKLHCEVISSAVSAADAEAPSAAVSLRIAPEDFPKLFESLGKSGRIVEHTTSAEDKTGDVIDTEAETRNLSSYRDSLRGLLNRSSANLKDLIDIQQKLADVQSKLDSLAAKRKVLANETEKVSVEIHFAVHYWASGPGFLARIGAALRQSGDVLAGSIGALILFAVGIAPWLLVLIPSFLVLRNMWRRWRRRRISGAGEARGPVAG